MTGELTIRAIGTPTPVGSFFAKIVGKGRAMRAIVVPDNSKSKPWRDDVIAAAKSAIRAAAWLPLTDAVEVEIRFFLPRPKTVRRLLPFVKPDVDKLARNLLDGLTAAHVFADDALVTDLIARKRYAEPGQPCGARIRVTSMADQMAVI